MTTIGALALAVLETAGARDKAAASLAAAATWRVGGVTALFDRPAPDRPARPEHPALCPAGQMPKRGRGGSERGRIALLHALAHIELNAIDLAWDVALRFGAGLPCVFVDDWIGVGEDEATHFLLLDDRLRALGSHYGALPAHDGLWESARSTADDLAARLAVVPQVLEARGLDVSPATAARLRTAGDMDSAAIVERIYHDEIGHVAIGNRWFRWACVRDGRDPATTFQLLVRQRFGGAVKPPFNDSARLQAGLTPDFYMPLAERP